MNTHTDDVMDLLDLDFVEAEHADRERACAPVIEVMYDSQLDEREAQEVMG